jgi:hypothetical protein
MMQMLRNLIVAMSMCQYVFTAAAHANTVTAGVNTAANAIPFSSGAFYSSEYQQIYRGGVFSGPVKITGLAFTSSDVFQQFGLTVRLSTTQNTPLSPGSSFASNLGPDLTSVFSGNVKTTGASSFNFIVNFTTPFTFDPSAGGLAVDLLVNAPPAGSHTFRAGNSNDLARLWSDEYGSGVSSNYGLQTQFAFEQLATAVPLPGFAWEGLLLGGGIGLFRLARGRAKAQSH